MELLARERADAGDPDVLRAACTGLGRLRDPRAIPIFLDLVTHSAAIVRFSVMSDLSNHNVPEAIEALIVLSADPDEAVRDWATFRLGEDVEG